MAIYDLEEQEQIDTLKQFWRDYGKLIILAALAFVLGVAGTQGWKYHKSTQAQAASLKFVELEQAVAKGDVNEIRHVADEIIADFASTPYGAMSALVLAKTERDGGDLDAAAQRLEWAAENAPTEELQVLAALRLAAVRLDQEQYDAALALLDKTPSESFVGVYSDLRGDVLLAQGNVAEARAQYQQALDETAETSPWRDVVQIKLDALSAD